MKRYSLSIIIVALIVAGIGTYYVQGTMDRLPEYKLTRIEGSAEEGARIELSGAYGGRRQTEVITVKADGSDYQNEQSWYQNNISNNRSWHYSQSDIKQIIDDHRSFMRGKGISESFYRDDEYVIYAQARVQDQKATTSEVTLEIEVLTEASNKVNRHVTTVNEQLAFAHTNVVDVQRIDNHIHIIAVLHAQRNQVAKTNQTATSEFHDYIVDLTTGKLIQSKKLTFGPEEGDADLDISVITNETVSAPSDYVLLRVREGIEDFTDQPQASIVQESNREKLYSYFPRTGEVTAISGLSEENLKGNPRYSLNGSMLTIYKDVADSFVWTRYDLETRREQEGIPTLTVFTLGVDRIGSSFVVGERIYMLLKKNNIPMAAVVDATNGQLLYKGIATYEGPALKIDIRMKDLRLLNIGIRS
jgi:hypothetical protein